jgi:hypothetical protein
MKVSRWLIVVLAVGIVWTFELLADFRPFQWVFWTHKQAMDLGGLGFIAVALWAVLLRRDR